MDKENDVEVIKKNGVTFTISTAKKDDPIYTEQKVVIMPFKKKKPPAKEEDGPTSSSSK